MGETVEKKTKRSVLKRAKIEAVKEAARKGQSVAYLNNLPTSPRKMRLVADLIRGQRVNHALNILKYEAKHPSGPLEKLLISAIKNWELKNTDAKLEEADLYVKEIFVDGGRILKRLRPAPQGRAHRVRKRSNHVTLVVDSMPTGTAVAAEAPAEAAQEVKTEQKAKKESKKTNEKKSKTKKTAKA
jgi:large subunit ribosomal protein L22